MLFHSTIFGPVHSRRLGVSLGINLSPDNGKLCSFDCVYCECGLNADGREDSQIPSQSTVYNALKEVLSDYAQRGQSIDTLTFAGNGEPTLHPAFKAIVQDVNVLRNRYMPQAKISVLTNAWQLWKPEVAEALRLVDNNILKLDTAVPETLLRLNRPVNPQFSMQELLTRLATFSGTCIIQTLFLRGRDIDNTTEPELQAWLAALKQIAPRLVQLYSIARKTPFEDLQAVPKAVLEQIAARVRALGIQTQVTA